MENYALAIANYFIDLAHSDGKPIRPLKLMKLVYIAHGYILALLDKPTDGAKLEEVEAWQYGPVFPSVYYSFKQYGSQPIDKKTTVFDFNKIGSGEDCVYTPSLECDDEKRVCEFVWRNYRNFKDSELVSKLHMDGTPWKECYKQGLNVVIPDKATKRYYTLVAQNISKRLNKQSRKDA